VKRYNEYSLLMLYSSWDPSRRLWNCEFEGIRCQ